MGSSTNSKNAPPSSNWLALQKVSTKCLYISSSTSDVSCLQKVSRSKRGSSVSAFAARKKRKLSHPYESPAPSTSTSSVAPHTPIHEVNDFPRGESSKHSESVDVVEDGTDMKNGEAVVDLQRMVLGQVEHSAAHRQCVSRCSVLAHIHFLQLLPPHFHRIKPGKYLYLLRDGRRRHR